MFKPKEVMRSLLVLLLLGAFQIALFWLFNFEVPESNRDLVVFMLGQLSGFTGAGVAYYLGTSKSSSDKNDIIAQRVDSITHVDAVGETLPIRHSRPLSEPNFGQEEEL